MSVFFLIHHSKNRGSHIIITYKTCPVYLFLWKLKTVKWPQLIHRIVSGTYRLYSKQTHNTGHTFQNHTVSTQYWQHRHETFTRILSEKLKWRNHLSYKLRQQDAKMNLEETRQAYGLQSVTAWHNTKFSNFPIS